jgi:hypothetical protein
MAELGTKPQLHRHTGRPQCQDGVEGKVEANGAEEKEHGVDDNYYGIAASARAAMSKVRSVHATINETWPIRMERQAPHPRSPSCLPTLDYSSMAGAGAASGIGTRIGNLLQTHTTTLKATANRASSSSDTALLHFCFLLRGLGSPGLASCIDAPQGSPMPSVASWPS